MTNLHPPALNDCAQGLLQADNLTRAQVRANILSKGEVHSNSVQCIHKIGFPVLIWLRQAVILNPDDQQVVHFAGVHS